MYRKDKSGFQLKKKKNFVLLKIKYIIVFQN